MSKDPSDQPIKEPDVKIINNVPFDGLSAAGSGMYTAKCVYNIVINAIKFTDEVSITVYHRLEGDSHIVIIVTDTGVGIPEDN